jgi:acetyltransferase-like isoleucine patch superfamily enzyme
MPECKHFATTLNFDEGTKETCDDCGFVLSDEKSTVIYEPCNIYSTAEIGKNVNIGMFTEIGNKVSIGNNVRIGAMCYIPEGVIIKDNAWIGPRVTFTNDKYPPSGKKFWEKTIIKKGARIGAGVTVLPGISIGENALIGAGSVVTRDIPANAKCCGVPAKIMNENGNGNDRYNK